MRPREWASLASWEMASSLKKGFSLPGFSHAAAYEDGDKLTLGRPPEPFDPYGLATASSAGTFFLGALDLSLAFAPTSFFGAGGLSGVSAALLEPGMN